MTLDRFGMANDGVYLTVELELAHNGVLFWLNLIYKLLSCSSTVH